MNLLAIVREHARRQGLPVPASVAANQDGYCQQARGLLNEYCDDLNTRKVWQANIRHAEWYSTPTESQGKMSTLAPFGFEGIVPETSYEHLQNRPCNSLTASEWALRKSQNFAGPYSDYRLAGDEFLLNPVPSPGFVYSFDYYSSSFVRFPGAGAVPETFRRYWENDLDESTIDPAMAIAYLRWSWKREKGFDYAEDFLKYEKMVLTKSSRDASPQKVSMDGSCRGFRPGILVPLASWNLP